MKKTTFNENIKYIRINSIDEIDFENLPESAKKQLAKAYSSLLSKQIKDTDRKDSTL